jgi:Transmembrane secretion effector
MLPYVRARIGSDQLVLGGGLLAAVMTGVLAITSHIAIAAAVVLLIGIASLAILSTLMLSAQVALPEWVKARGLAVTQMVFSGALTAGSLVWGTVANHLGISWTLALAAGGLAVASVGTLRWRLALDTIDRTPSQHWPEPVVVGDITGDGGPVMVTVEYRVDPVHRIAFAEALERLGQVRRRDGALFWEHFTDTADPTRHIETFIAENWIEHLRQHERVTLGDRALEEEVRAFQVGDKNPIVTHLVSARARS